jgi:quinol monooxygenase YgiN
MIIFRVVAKPKPGKLEDAKAAAAVVREEGTRDAPGVLILDFFLNEATGELVIIEAYQDSEAFLEHVRRMPTSELSALIDISSLDVHGDPSSEAMDVINRHGSAVVHPRV